MSDFTEFYDAILEIAKKFEKNGTVLRIEKDESSQIVKIYGSNFSSLDRARNGIEDVLELSLTAAEHHPYWALLYNCSQILKTTVERWDSNLTKDDLDEIQWMIKELEHSCKKLNDLN